jgi:hypothetical protein
MIERWVRRKLLGPKKKKVAGDWRKVFNGYVHNFTLHHTGLMLSNKEGVIDGVCCTHGKEQKCIRGSGWET